MKTGVAKLLRPIPFLRILPPIIVGIVLANTYHISNIITVAALAVCYAMAWIGRNTQLSWGYVWGAIIFTFMLICNLNIPHTSLPEGEKLIFTAQITQRPNSIGRWQSTTAQIGSYRLDSDSARVWHKINTKILIYIDTSLSVSTAQQLVCRAYINPINDGSYARLMSRRGYHGRAYITPGNILAHSKYSSSTPTTYSRSLQEAAINNLQKLNLTEAQLSIALTMAAGDKRTMDRKLKADYSKVGAAHLLAVSGLHMGIVFSLINLLLWPLPLIRRGHIIKNIAVIVVIWIYAAMTGLSPSVLRAALMFSGAQIALATTSHHNGLNILLGAAALILAISPNNLYDISFQLSFVAVLFIVLWFRPLYSRLQTRSSIINLFISLTLIGVIASIGVAPLVAHTFGNIPFIGILINPIVVITAHIVLLGSLVWIICPISSFEPIFSYIVGGAVDIQNTVVSWSATKSWSAVESSLSEVSTIIIYTAYILITIIIANRAKKELSLPR